MKNYLKSIFTGLVLLSSNSFSAPVEYDTPDAHIVVIRPMDQWNPDESSLKKLDSSFFNGGGLNLGYYDATEGNGIKASSDDGLAPQIRAKFPSSNLMTEFGAYSMLLGKPQNVTPEQAKNLVITQARLYEANIYNQGNPAQLSRKISDGQILRNILTVATIGVAGKFGGVNLASSVAGSPIAVEIGGIPIDVQKLIISAKPVTIDFSRYQSIDIRMSAYGVKQFGQVIIAYKNPKTKDIEDAALIIAVASTGGLDTTKEATMASRAADLADRQAIWDKCVADGKCKNEE